MKEFQIGNLIKHKHFGDIRVIVSERTTKAGNKEFKLSGESYYIYARTIQKVFLLLSK